MRSQGGREVDILFSGAKLQQLIVSTPCRRFAAGGCAGSDRLVECLLGGIIVLTFKRANGDTHITRRMKGIRATLVPRRNDLSLRPAAVNRNFRDSSFMLIRESHGCQWWYISRDFVPFLVTLGQQYFAPCGRMFDYNFYTFSERT